MSTDARPARQRPHIVIVGAGFGGLEATRALARSPVDITLVDRRNYHLFQPLLYQVATAALSPAHIAWPIRSIFGRQRNVRVQMGRVSGVDTARREVIVEHRRIPYDSLVLATGARHAYFGHEEWEEVAPGLKKIADATDIRERLLLAFEQAELAADPAQRQALLTFVVIGGGPTGVEMAGAISELARFALARDFRAIDPAETRVLLVEAGPRILPVFPDSLSDNATRALQRLGVDVRCGVPVTHCGADSVTVGDDVIACRTIVWAAGVMASPAAKWLGVPADRAGRVRVEPDLSVAGHEDVFVIGDTALVAGPDGRPVPGIAPAAKQMGRHVGRLIDARVRGRRHPGPFRYRHAGNLATIGRKAAVVDFGRIRLTGFVAWLLWAVAHVWFLIGWRNRLAVAIDWAWSYVTLQRGARLITGALHESQPPPLEAAAARDKAA
ncbi:MAG: NAD(P)/FAD-dependent oxidoreductase [Geminicoccaceae bacterium]